MNQRFTDDTAATETLINLIVEPNEGATSWSAPLSAPGARAKPMNDYGFIIPRACVQRDCQNWAMSHMNPAHIQPEEV